MEELTVEIRGENWKLADIREDIDWCKSRTWRLEVYDEVGEHTHCLIFSWTLMPSADLEVGRGYRSGPNSWLCSECHGKFIATA